MIRVRLPGGVCTPAQWLKLDELARAHGGETLRMVLPEQSASGLRPGDDVPIAIDINKIHIFRAASGQVMT